MSGQLGRAAPRGSPKALRGVSLMFATIPSCHALPEREIYDRGARPAGPHPASIVSRSTDTAMIQPRRLPRRTGRRARRLDPTASRRVRGTSGGTPARAPVRGGGAGSTTDRVAGSHLAAASYDGHHPGLAHQPAVGVAAHHLPQQPGLEAVDLHARVAQPGDHDLGGVAEQQHGAGRQREQVDAAGRDVLAEVAGEHPGPSSCTSLEQLGVDQVHLAQVGLVGVAAHPGAVLHRPPRWASPSTPRPSTSRITGRVCLLNRCPAAGRDRDHPGGRAGGPGGSHRIRRTVGVAWQ